MSKRKGEEGKNRAVVTQCVPSGLDSTYANSWCRSRGAGLEWVSTGGMGSVSGLPEWCHRIRM